MKTALILAGSGARGIIQAGMIKAFVDLGLTYDTLYGASAGALNGAMLHAGEIQQMINMWFSIRNKDCYSNAPWNVWIKNKGSIYDSTPLLRTLQKVVNTDKLRQNEKPFWINVTDISHWTSFRVSHRAADVVKYLWTSASPPILMPPVQDPFGRWLTDGGVTNNYSISDAVNDGADRLIVFAPMIPEPKPVNSVIDAIDITVSVQLYNQLQRELKFVEKLNSVPGFKKIEVIVVQLDKPSGIGILDFDQSQYRRNEAFNTGYRLARMALAGLKARETV